MVSLTGRARERVGMSVTAEHTKVLVVGGSVARIPAPVAA
jgi:hypothetical protein